METVLCGIINDPVVLIKTERRYGIYRWRIAAHEPVGRKAYSSKNTVTAYCSATELGAAGMIRTVGVQLLGNTCLINIQQRAERKRNGIVLHYRTPSFTHQELHLPLIENRIAEACPEHKSKVIFLLSIKSRNRCKKHSDDRYNS